MPRDARRRKGLPEAAKRPCADGRRVASLVVSDDGREDPPAPPTHLQWTAFPSPLQRRAGGPGAEPLVIP